MANDRDNENLILDMDIVPTSPIDNAQANNAARGRCIPVRLLVSGCVRVPRRVAPTIAAPARLRASAVQAGVWYRSSLGATGRN